MALSDNYDRLAELVTALRNQVNDLDDLGASLVGNRAVAQAQQVFRSAWQEKEEVVERFKSYNSVLRNSVNYVPEAERLIKSLYDNAGSSSDLLLVERLAAEALEYTVLAAPENQQSLNQLLQQMRTLAAAETTPDSVAIEMSNMVNHVQTIIENKPITDNLLRDVVLTPTGTSIDGLMAAYANGYKVQATLVNSYRSLLIGYAVVLLLALAYLGYRLTSSYRALGEKNSELNKALKQVRDSQSQLVQSEKMASLGQMVAGIAHEVNTPLGFVKSNVGIIHSLLPDINDLFAKYKVTLEHLMNPEAEEAEIAKELEELSQMAETFEQDGVLEEAQELLDDADTGLTQISELVLSLKDFSRLDSAQSDMYSVHKGLDSALLLAKNILKGKVDVVKDYGEIPEINCVPSQINQIFLNLISNAAQAMDERGEIRLSTRVDDEFVEIKVSDNGQGIPQEILSKIFDPFFTTKKVGEGTGLGLSIVYRIVEDHKGHIDVQSELGVGTTFTIRLPMAWAEEQALAA